MDIIQFHAVVGHDQVIRPPAGVALPPGEVEVTVRPAPAPIGPNGRAPTCYELAKKARVIGMVKNAPPDLSTNKKYLEGLGER